MVRKFRKRPPIPRDLRHVGKPAGRINYYGAFDSKTGKPKRFSWKVEHEAGVSGRVMYKRVRNVCKLLKNNLIPRVPNGHVFKSYKDLLITSRPWMRVRKVTSYKKGRIEYER